uniref:Wsv037-like protein n=1 Tax=Marsupenaeus japonicus endogenous nimavirus TaxID=2133793 RepID=A0A401IP81_9VIRU|nr:wsv037-like protein [Marsupenaeus japonicus endogenous nimavirus]
MEKFLSDSIQGVDVLSSFKIKTFKHENNTLLIALRDFTKTIPGVSSEIFLVRGGGPSSRERMILSMDVLDVLQDYTNSVSTVAPVSWQVFNNPDLHTYLIRRLTECNLFNKNYFSNDPLPGIGELVSFKYRGGIPQNIIFPIGASTVNWLCCVKSSRRMGEILIKRPLKISDANYSRNIRLVKKQLVNKDKNITEDDIRRLRFWRYFYFIEDATERGGMMHHNPFAMSHVSFDINITKASPVNEHDFSLAFTGDCFSRESIILSDIVCGGRTSNFFPLLQAILQYKYCKNDNLKNDDIINNGYWTDVWERTITKSGYRLQSGDMNDPMERLKHIIRSSDCIHTDKKNAVIEYLSTVLHFSQREILNNITISSLAIKEEVEEFLLVMAIKQEWVLLYSILQQIQFNILHFIGYHAHRILIFKLFVPILIAVLYTNGSLSQTVVHAAVSLKLNKRQAGYFTLSNVLNRSMVYTNPIDTTRHFSQFDQNDPEGFVSSTLSVPLVTDVANMLNGLSSKMEHMDFLQKYGMSILKSKIIEHTKEKKKNSDRKTPKKKTKNNKSNNNTDRQKKNKTNKKQTPIKKQKLSNNNHNPIYDIGGNVDDDDDYYDDDDDNNDDDNDNDNDNNNINNNIINNNDTIMRKASTSIASFVDYDPGEGCSTWNESDRITHRKKYQNINTDNNLTKRSLFNEQGQSGRNQDDYISCITLSNEQEDVNHEKIQAILKRPSKRKDFDNNNMPFITLKVILNLIEECFGIKKGTIITSIHANVRDFSKKHTVSGNTSNGYEEHREDGERAPRDFNIRKEIQERFLELIMDSPGSRKSANMISTERHLHNEHLLEALQLNPLFRAVEGASDPLERVIILWNINKYINMMMIGLITVDLASLIDQRKGARKALRRGTVMKQDEFNYREAGNAPGEMRDMIVPHCISKLTCISGKNYKNQTCHHFFCRSLKTLFISFDPDKATETFIDKASQNTLLRLRNFCRKKGNVSMQDWNEQVFKPIASGNGWVSENNNNKEEEENYHSFINMRQPKDFFWLLKRIIIERELLACKLSKDDVKDESNKMRPMGFYREPYFPIHSGENNNEEEENEIQVNNFRLESQSIEKYQQRTLSPTVASSFDILTNALENMNGVEENDTVTVEQTSKGHGDGYPPSMSPLSLSYTSPTNTSRDIRQNTPNIFDEHNITNSSFSNNNNNDNDRNDDINFQNITNTLPFTPFRNTSPDIFQNIVTTTTDVCDDNSINTIVEDIDGDHQNVNLLNNHLLDNTTTTTTNTTVTTVTTTTTPSKNNIKPSMDIMIHL